MTKHSFHHQKILIIDFGSQVTQLIARRVREQGVYCEIHGYDVAEDAFDKLNPVGVILSGGPFSVFDAESPRAPERIFTSGVPILAICYGQQTACFQMGGRLERESGAEYGRASVLIEEESALFKGVWSVGEHYPVWMSHSDRVVTLPKGFSRKATSHRAPFAVASDESRRIYTTMFHPEVVHTPDGAKLIRNFLYEIANCSGDWTMASFLEEQVHELRERIGDQKVLCALSGGVDSSVLAALLHEAIGDRLTCVFVDHGFMRQDEPEQIVRIFREHCAIRLIHIEAADIFEQKLADVSDPEEKRKIIGRTFIDVFEEQARQIGEVAFLAQGTLYPDVVESRSAGGQKGIKSHHNVGGLPERMNLQLIEPFRALFKDEVRCLGAQLHLPDVLIERHPFPGPGLAIRCLGVVTQDRLALLKKADAIYLEEIRKEGLYNEIWQAFAVLLPVKTVGVMGDARTYEYVVALRAITSIDGMTADFYPHDMAFLGRVATRIINETRGVNRVVYDITSKPPGTVEWE